MPTTLNFLASGVDCDTGTWEGKQSIHGLQGKKYVQRNVLFRFGFVCFLISPTRPGLKKLGVKIIYIQTQRSWVTKKFTWASLRLGSVWVNRLVMLALYSAWAGLHCKVQCSIPSPTWSLAFMLWNVAKERWCSEKVTSSRSREYLVYVSPQHFASATHVL